MDVDSGVGVGLFGDHAGDYRDTEFKQAVGYAVTHRGTESRIADDDLMCRGCGRIAEIGGVNIGVEYMAQGRKASYELIGNNPGTVVRVRY